MGDNEAALGERHKVAPYFTFLQGCNRGGLSWWTGAIVVVDVSIVSRYLILRFRGVALNMTENH